MTAYAKKLTTEGYRKTKVAELVAGQTVMIDGEPRVFERVEPRHAASKNLVFAGGFVTSRGNASKVWAK